MVYSTNAFDTNHLSTFLNLTKTVNPRHINCIRNLRVDFRPEYLAGDALFPIYRRRGWEFGDRQGPRYLEQFCNQARQMRSLKFLRVAFWGPPTEYERQIYMKILNGSLGDRDAEYYYFSETMEVGKVHGMVAKRFFQDQQTPRTSDSEIEDSFAC